MPKGVPVDVVGYWFPPDGRGPVGNDTITVLKGAPNPVLAHLFLNYMLDLQQRADEHQLQRLHAAAQRRSPRSAWSRSSSCRTSLMSTAVLPSYFRRGVRSCSSR